MSETLNIVKMWEDTGIVAALLPAIREVFRRFVPDDHNITYNQAVWTRRGDGVIGTIVVCDENGEEQEIACFPISTRWDVDVATAHMVMAFQVLPTNHNTEGNDESEEDEGDDLTEGRWYAVPVGLAPTSIRSKVEKAFQEVGLLSGRLPGLRQYEWDNSDERRMSLTFQNRRGNLIAWWRGKACVLAENSRPPKAGKEVVCVVVAEHLNKLFVNWTGMTTEQTRKRADEQRRLAGLRSVVRRAKAVERPELADPVVAMGLEPDKLSGGRLNSAYRQLRQQIPTTEEEAASNPLAKAMAEVGLPFKAGDQNWPVLYAEYLDQANRATVEVLKAKRAKEREARDTVVPPPEEPATVPPVEDETHEEAAADALDAADILVEEPTGEVAPEEGANAK